MPWRVVLAGVLARTFGLGLLEVRRMPLSLALLYCHAAAQGEGMETRWACGADDGARRGASEVRRRIEELRRA